MWRNNQKRHNIQKRNIQKHISKDKSFGQLFSKKVHYLTKINLKYCLRQTWVWPKKFPPKNFYGHFFTTRNNFLYWATIKKIWSKNFNPKGTIPLPCFFYTGKNPNFPYPYPYLFLHCPYRSRIFSDSGRTRIADLLDILCKFPDFLFSIFGDLPVTYSGTDSHIFCPFVARPRIYKFRQFRGEIWDGPIAKLYNTILAGPLCACRLKI